MDFKTAMQREANVKYTENGALAYSTTENALLDLFGTIGALRPRTEQDIEDKFAAAFNQDKLLATKMLFYAGNVRGGLGERRTFRICLKWLARNYPDIVKLNIGLIPYFNRWDSVFTLVGTPAEKEMWQVVNEQIVADLKGRIEGQPISLLAKWLPSINTSSDATRALAKKVIRNTNFGSQKEYRQALSMLRAHLRIVEKSMSSAAWDKILYAQVPSYAMKRYGSAFAKHDFERFNQYLADLKSGKTKVNASVLYPYDLVSAYMGYSDRNDSLVEEQWKALPNYVKDESSIIVMADVSESMSGRPMATSIGLAIYFAERNIGPFHGVYMTFTDKPHFISVNENATLREKVNQVRRTDVGYSTNLEAAFKYLLSTATYHNISPEQMPKAICVISDMEINPYFRDPRAFDFVAKMEQVFASNGYKLPTLIMWNVDARQDTFLSQSDKVKLISGQSPSAFKTILESIEGTNWDTLLKALNDPMYDCVKIAA